MNYYKIAIETAEANEDTNDVLIALLAEFAFETFEEVGQGQVWAYVQEAFWDATLQAQLDELCNDWDATYTSTFIPYQNWNETWESHFNPIQVGDFVAMRADFHAPTEGVRFDLVINPKMAFGTGHHETTYMMVEQMKDMDFEGTRVLDYGCGTGILAILASKLGAHYLEAVDIEWPSYENTIENAAINGVANILPFCGTLDTIETADFDIILANINRNVILNSLPVLHQKTKPGGFLLISGFLKADEMVMLSATTAQGFQTVRSLQKGNWLCILLQKA